jgi:hypothetical protein
MSQTAAAVMPAQIASRRAKALATGSAVPPAWLSECKSMNDVTRILSAIEQEPALKGSDIAFDPIVRDTFVASDRGTVYFVVAPVRGSAD